MFCSALAQSLENLLTLVGLLLAKAFILVIPSCFKLCLINILSIAENLDKFWTHNFNCLSASNLFSYFKYKDGKFLCNSFAVCILCNLERYGLVSCCAHFRNSLLVSPFEKLTTGMFKFITNVLIIADGEKIMLFSSVFSSVFTCIVWKNSISSVGPSDAI